MNLPHRYTHLRWLAGAAALILFAAACGSDESHETESGTGSDVGSSSAIATEPAADDASVPAVEPASADSTTTTTVASTTTTTTVAPTTTTTVAPTFTGDEADVAAAWALVFDSTTDFEDKLPHLDDAESLASTVEAYTATGDGFGGISLVPTAVTIDGDAATVTYDVIFGGNPAYSDITGTINLVNSSWVVPRSEFCSFMASARVGCEN
jgi:iron complex transport system substrate-binding protein